MIALALMAVGLIAIIGLIPQGVKSSRDAADNTLVATIVHDTFNGIRLQAQTAWPPSTLTAPPLLLTAPQDIFYDAAGTNQVGAGSADRYFHVRLTPLSSQPNMLGITATITWPDKSALSTPLNTNFFFTQIANYQR
jgi:uncharacterized protein (TIGR02598 family)